MTVHNFIQSFALGDVKPLPKNKTFNDLRDYAASRFGMCLILVGDKLDGPHIKRVCPSCRR